MSPGSRGTEVPRTFEAFRAEFTIARDSYGSLPWHAMREGVRVLLYTSREWIEHPTAGTDVPLVPSQAMNFRTRREVEAALRMTHDILANG